MLLKIRCDHIQIFTGYACIRDLKEILSQDDKSGGSQDYWLQALEDCWLI